MSRDVPHCLDTKCTFFKCVFPGSGGTDGEKTRDRGGNAQGKRWFTGGRAGPTLPSGVDSDAGRRGDGRLVQ